MFNPKRLSTKILSSGLGLLVVALLSIAMTMWFARQLDGGAAAVNEAGRLRMQAWRLVSALGGGREPGQVAQMLQQMDASIALLQQGDPNRPLAVPWSEPTRARFKALQSAWLQLRPQWDTSPPGGGAALTPQVDAFVGQVDAFVLSIEDTLARYTTLLNLFQFLMMALAVAAAMLLLYVGYLFVIQPLKHIQQGLEKVEAGDFSVRLNRVTHDEFGDLAAGFNHMTATLQNLYGGLERKVQEKTRALEAERSRLAALYEVSHFLTQPHRLDEWVQGFVNKVKRVSGAQAVAVRWTDEAHQNYPMLANNGSHEVYPSSGVGYDTRVQVPIRLQQKVLGEVELFYQQPLALTPQDRELYEALSGHLAAAVESLRLDVLQREKVVNEERAMLARELHDSIAQALAFLRIQVSMLRNSLGSQPTAQIDQILNEIDQGVKECTNDVRALLVHFRTRAHVDDIEQALRTTLHKFEHQSGLPADLEIHGHGPALPADVQLQVLHIVQEALSNVRKHAAADHVRLVVQRGPTWHFAVRDNGGGFDVAATEKNPGAHLGLQIMRERAQSIGAALRLVSTPEVGSEVHIAVEAP